MFFGLGHFHCHFIPPPRILVIVFKHVYYHLVFVSCGLKYGEYGLLHYDVGAAQTGCDWDLKYLQSVLLVLRECQSGLGCYNSTWVKAVSLCVGE